MHKINKIYQVINKNVLTSKKGKFYLFKYTGYYTYLVLVFLIFTLLVLKLSLPRLSENLKSKIFI